MSEEKRLGVSEAAEPSLSQQDLMVAQKALVDEAYARLEVFREGCQEVHSRAKEARRIALMDDPRQDIPGTRGMEKTLQLPTLRSTLNNCIADQMDNMPEAVMLPEEPAMQKVAEDLTDVVRFVLAQNGYEAMHRKRAEDLFVAGTAVTQITWDEDMDFGDGNIRLIRWPVEGFLWDPIAEDIQDARALIKVSWHPLSWYAEHYPDAAPYVASDTYAHNEVGVPEAWSKNSDTDEGRAMMLEYWYRRYDAKKRRYTVNVALIAGRALLDMAEDVYAHGMYPFVLDVYEKVEGSPAGNSMVNEFADIMRYVNRYYHYFDYNMRAASKMRLLVQRAAGIDEDALTDYSKEIIMGTSIEEAAVRWFQPNMVSGAGTGVAIQLQTDIKQDSGQNQFTRGETAGGVTAASAIAALQEAGGKITRLRTSTLNQGFKRIVEQVIWLISEFYTDEKTKLVTGGDGKQRPVDMRASHLLGGNRGRNTLPPPPYSVQVQVNRRNPMRVQAQNELFIQAYSMAAQAQQPFPLTVLFEMLNVDGKDAIMGVLREAEARNDQMAQMAEALQGAQEGIEERDQAIENLKSALAQQDQALTMQ